MPLATCCHDAPSTLLWESTSTWLVPVTSCRLSNAPSIQQLDKNRRTWLSGRDLRQSIHKDKGAGIPSQNIHAMDKKDHPEPSCSGYKTHGRLTALRRRHICAGFQASVMERPRVLLPLQALNFHQILNTRRKRFAVGIRNSSCSDLMHHQEHPYLPRVARCFQVPPQPTHSQVPSYKSWDKGEAGEGVEGGGTALDPSQLPAVCPHTPQGMHPVMRWGVNAPQRQNSNNVPVTITVHTVKPTMHSRKGFHQTRKIMFSGV